MLENRSYSDRRMEDKPSTATGTCAMKEANATRIESEESLPK